MKNTKPQIQPPAPFHLFKYQGRDFAYHYALGEFIAVSSAAAAMIQGIYEGCKTVQDISDAVLREDIVQLEKAGFFRPFANPVYSEREMEVLLDKRYDAPWTKLELALSETCNLACRYCYCGTCRDKVQNKGLMTEEVARQAINWLFAMSGRA